MDLLNKSEPITCARRSREAYTAERESGFANYDTQITYALDLLKTTDKKSLETAETLLQNGFSSDDDAKKRECLFLIAVANTKLGHYEKAITCCNNLLAVNPNDHQSSDLKAEIERRRRREGLIGISVVGTGALVFLGGILAVLMVGLRR